MIKKLIGIIRLKPWLSIVTVIYAAGMIAIAIPKSMDQTEDSDHWIVWQAGKDFSEGKELYYRDKIRPYISPPFSAFVYQPFHLMPLKVSNLVLFLLNSLVLLPLAIYLIYKILRLIGVDARKAEVSLILATVFTLKFFWNNLVMFQINFVLFEVMLIGFYCLARKKPHIAGVLFTIITFIKIIPVFLAAYVFLFHFSRKVVISMVTTALICLTLPMAFRGKDLWVQDHVDNYEILIKHYIVEGTIVADRVNHSLKSGMLKTFYPETRHIVDVNPDKYPLILRIAGFMQLMMLGVIITNGIILFRRKVWFSLAYLSSILVFSHLYAMITWTAHLVTLLFCILPVLLIDVRKLPKPGKIAFWIFIGLMVFLGIEGSDTVGEKIYQAIHHYDLHTLMLMGLFIFSSWVVLDKRSAGIFPDGIQI